MMKITDTNGKIIIYKQDMKNRWNHEVDVAIQQMKNRKEVGPVGRQEF